MPSLTQPKAADDGSIGEGYATQFHPERYAEVERLAHTVNRSAFTAFVDECGRHALPAIERGPQAHPPVEIPQGYAYALAVGSARVSAH
jgi:hypothetical protein